MVLVYDVLTRFSASAKSTFRLFLDWKKWIRKNKKVRTFSSSPRGVLDTARFWKPSKVSGIDLYLRMSTSMLVLGWKKGLNRIKAYVFRNTSRVAVINA